MPDDSKGWVGSKIKCTACGPTLFEDFRPTVWAECKRDHKQKNMFCRKCQESSCATRGCENVILRHQDKICIECVKARGEDEKTYTCGQCHVMQIHSDFIRSSENKLMWQYYDATDRKYM